MDKAKARKMYELADRLSQVDTSSLNEQQLAERSAMIQRLGEELKAMKKGVAEGSEQKPSITYKDYTFQYDYQTEDDDPEGYSTATTYHFDVLKDGKRVGDAEFFDYFGDLTIRINGKTTKYEHRHPLASQISELVSSLPEEQKKDLSDPRFESQGVAEADEEDLHTSFNVVKLGGALDTDPRSLRAAIQRSMQGSPTRTDTMTLANAFMNLLKNSDDQQIQAIANLIKAGNPNAVPQESTAAIAERNAFVDAMRQVKKGEKFTVGGKEFTKTTTHGEDEEVKEAVDTEAYDRLKRVFDFSDYKG